LKLGCWHKSTDQNPKLKIMYLRFTELTYINYLLINVNRFPRFDYFFQKMLYSGMCTKSIAFFCGCCKTIGIHKYHSVSLCTKRVYQC
jgi:hypothetical protein